MKKLIHNVFCYTKRKVVDVETQRPEIATYIMLFGIVIKTTYKGL